MANPYTTGGQLTSSSIQEPERLFEFTQGQRTMLPSTPAIAPSAAALETTRPAMMTMAPLAPSLRPPVSASPLGGMDPRPMSARAGGPMSYSQQGVGTTNPNAFAVGQNRAPLGMRMLSRAARRRDPRAIMALAGMEQQNAMQGQQLGMMQMREAADAERFNAQQQNQMTLFERQQQAMQERDATNFQQQQQMFQMQSQQRAGESALEFQRRQELERAQREAESIVGDATIPMQGGSVPAVRTKGGTVRMAGGFMPEKPPITPMTADDIAAARSMGGRVSVPLPGGGQVDFSPVEAPKPTMIKVMDPMSGRVMDFPDNYELPEGWTALRVKGSTPAAAPAAAAPATAAAGAALKTKSGNSYTLK